MKQVSKALLRYKSIFLLLALVIVAWISSSRFLTLANITNILQQVAPNGIAAIGLTLVVITGGFDMSIGSVMSLTGVITMMSLRAGMGLGVSMGFGLLIGLATGLLNGVLIALIGINPFISTLATQILVKGIALGITNAYPIPVWNDAFSRLSLGSVGFLPYSFLMVILLAILCEIFLKLTKAGHNIYICGSNREAGFSAGINMKRTLVMTHVLCGLIAAIGGLFLASKLGSGSPVVGGESSLLSMTAIIIGGNKLTGSKANLLRTIIGIFILGVLNNMMNLMGTLMYFQTIIRGVIVIAVIMLDSDGIRSFGANIKRKWNTMRQRISAA